MRFVAAVVLVAALFGSSAHAAPVLMRMPNGTYVNYNSRTQSVSALGAPLKMPSFTGLRTVWHKLFPAKADRASPPRSRATVR